jgi:lysylphosphatidylglycerol synthetase-like protein (DUF2156 family)
MATRPPGEGELAPADPPRSTSTVAPVRPDASLSLPAAGPPAAGRSAPEVTGAPAIAGTAAGSTGGATTAVVTQAPSCAGAIEVVVPLGRRVMIVGDLLLAPQPTPTSRALSADLAVSLDRWQGPGLVVICGNLFAPEEDQSAPPATPLGATGATPLGATGATHMGAALEAHPVLTAAIRAFTGGEDRRLLVLPGWRDPGLGSDPDLRRSLAHLGVEVATAVDLDLVTSAGTRRVVVRPGAPAPTGMPAAPPVAGRSWLAGIDRLEDPGASARFVTSRTLYRRLGRYLWVPPLVAVVAALVIRITFVFHGVEHLVRTAPGTRRALTHAYTASWPDRFYFTLGVVVVLELLLGLVVALASRRFWKSHGAGTIPPPWAGEAGRAPSGGLVVGDHGALDEARRLVGAGAAGLVTGGGLHAELTALDPGFYASPGGTTELVREHPGRLGLPPVFLHHRQASWIELETGADLHVRLLLADVDLPSSTVLERLVTAHPVVKGYKATADLHPALVASWPRGASWPPAPDVAADRVRARRVRRVSAAAIFVAGLVDLLIAVTPPLRGHLRFVEQFLPLGVAQAAGALTALAGIGLMMLARGVLRGQRRAWLVSVVLLALTLALHLVHGAELGGLALSGLVLLLMLVERRRFGAASDSGSARSAALTLVVGAAVAVVATFVAIEVTGAVRHHPLPSWPIVLWAATERLAGLDTVHLPDTVDDWAYPSMLAVGIGLAVVALYLLTRPVVDRRLSGSRAVTVRHAAEARARDIVRRHGAGTLDYFALRDDKQWFFHRDSLVAYAVYGGVCLVSPDPIGPRSEQEQAWHAFRTFADRHGWAVGVMGAAEEWLPIYLDSGMRQIYIGDEAIVDVPSFSLAGGHMKGLRQAVNRVQRYGYTARVCEPRQVEPAMMDALADMMTRQRRGDYERGFSMTLGRIFDPRDPDLLLTVVEGPDGAPAAMCQFVPAYGIEGYSLDLMRRDPGEHPNGVLDYALCSTIEHLRAQGLRGLSLNFAAMRSTLEGESGDGLTQRVERWALRRLSGVLQIETLWRFNAKYGPSWLPRYIVWDSAESFVPTAVQIMRAESLTEIPVVGRLMTTGQGRRNAGTR